MLDSYFFVSLRSPHIYFTFRIPFEENLKDKLGNLKFYFLCGAHTAYT